MTPLAVLNLHECMQLQRGMPYYLDPLYERNALTDAERIDRHVAHEDGPLVTIGLPDQAAEGAGSTYWRLPRGSSRPIGVCPGD